MTSVLCLGALLTVPGCLIPEASESTPPSRTPPFIIDNTLDPPPYRVLSVRPNQAVPISFDVISEDAGDELVGALRFDFNAGGAHLLDQTYPPSTMAAGSRELKMTLQERNLVPPGCHMLTLFVMHWSSYDTETDLPRNEEAWEDVAMVNWVMSVSSPDLQVDPRLSDCPLPGQSGVASAEAP